MSNKKVPSELIGLEEQEYEKGKYREHILEQYKLFFNSAEQVTERRINMNRFCLSLITAVSGVIGYIKTEKIENDSYLVIGLATSAILICWHWIVQLENYRKLNSGKFKVIHQLERLVPLKLFEYEWEVLGKGEDPKLYRKTSNVDKSVPRIFGGLFMILVIVELWSMTS